jgi:hypothetical protein
MYSYSKVWWHSATLLIYFSYFTYIVKKIVNYFYHGREMRKGSIVREKMRELYSEMTFMFPSSTSAY